MSKQAKQFLSLTLGLFLLVTAAGCGAKPAPKPAGGLKVIGFYEEAQASNPPSPFHNLKAYPNTLDYLAPFWYSVHNDGSVSSTANPQTAAFARKNGIKLMPLFTNAGGAYAFMQDPATRSRAIANIVNIVEKNGYSGASIDFQLLPPSARQPLNTFVADLSNALKGKKKEISADVIPADTNQGAHVAYDYAALAKHTHRIILMTYDHHNNSTSPGPVAPLPWVKAAVKAAIKAGVPPNQIVLGLADYGYDWSSAGVVTLPLKNVRRLERRLKITPTWDSVSKEAHFTYTDSKGVSHTVWYQGKRGLASRIALAKRNKLWGMAIWRVGYENKSYWKTLDKLLHKK